MNGQASFEDGIIFVSDAAVAFEKIMPIVSVLANNSAAEAFARIFKDTRRLFEGRYPGYRASNTQYHDLAHTVSVALATARLLHGCREAGMSFSSENVLLTLTASLFHDIGLIQTEDDVNGSGAKYTVGHEERSVQFLGRYLACKGFSRQAIAAGADCIRCTILSLSPSDIPFSSDETKNCGYILGSADLLAQMADRLYLEKLLYLFKEFQEACLPGFDTELELLHKTKDFYEVVAKRRLRQDLDDIGRHMRLHFRKWMNIDANLYTEGISKNIDYLEMIIAQCQDSFDCFLEYLRRGGIAARIKEEKDEPGKPLRH